jgi:transcriptional regulator with XRE-family HTH domain
MANETGKTKKEYKKRPPSVPPIPKGKGAPSKFDQDMVEITTQMVAAGKTLDHIAKAVGVSKRTLERWLQSNKDFRRAVIEGRSLADELVEMSLYEMANGYTVEEEKVFMHEGKMVKAKIERKLPPDFRSISLWLRNRQPSKWRDKTETDLTSSDGTMTPAPAVVQIYLPKKDD